MRIVDVMSKKVVSVDPETPVAVARERLRMEEISHLVVVDQKRVVGVVSVKDVLPASDDVRVADIMSRNLATIEPNGTLRHAAAVMRGRGVGCLPVLDDGTLVGIVTTSDLLTAVAKGDAHAAPPESGTLRRRGRPRKRLTHHV